MHVLWWFLFVISHNISKIVFQLLNIYSELKVAWFFYNATKCLNCMCYALARMQFIFYFTFHMLNLCRSWSCTFSQKYYKIWHISFNLMLCYVIDLFKYCAWRFWIKVLKNKLPCLVWLVFDEVMISFWWVYGVFIKAKKRLVFDLFLISFWLGSHQTNSRVC